MDKPSESTEVDLMRRVASGDTEAFGLLYDRTVGVLYAVALRMLRDKTAAEDLLQEVYHLVWERAGAYEAARGKVVTWLITLTRNRAVDRLRATQRFERAMEGLKADQTQGTNTAGVGPPGSGWLDADRAHRVRGAVGALAPEQRQAIELAFFNGLTQSEIARLLEAPLGTVKARIRRGMTQLRQLLAEGEEAR